MKKQEFKTVNQTFSLCTDVSQELHIKELEVKKNRLRQAYLDANKDKGQLETMKAWESVTEDGLGEYK